VALALENEHLRVELDPSTGAVSQIENKGSDLRLVAGRPGPPWRIRLEDGAALEQHASPEAETVEHGVRLRWSSERGDVVQAAVTLVPGDPCVRFEVALSPAAGVPVEAIEYPLIAGIGSLAGEDDRLLHGYATGLLFHDPATLFRPEGEDRERGVLHGVYPEGFSGASLQLMAYYAAGRGGFSFATEDATGAQKWLNFYAEAGGLCAAVAHGTAVRGGPIEPPYAVAIGALVEGTWAEPADRYKAWAVEQPWCARGPLASQHDRPRWLHEEIGIATFGINPSRDRSAWIREIGRIAGTPVLHVLGPSWAQAPQDYQGHLPGGIDDWFPARFDPANLEAIAEHGDRTAPFLFDLLFGIGGTDAEEGAAALQQIPQPPRSLDAYTFPFLCPATPFARRLHADRDARLLAEPVDAVYYDISANNVVKQCHAEGHDHPPGGGASLVAAYRELFATPAAVRGTELVNEVFTDRLDFYQARAEASPAAAFEADRFRSWVKERRVEKVPLHAYVYHEYGPVRMDGWAKLSREQGDLFYWIAARVLAWGGLFELNYEFSPLETLDGVAEPLDEHYYTLPDRRFEIDSDKASFVGELAAARVGPANPYLAYGAMLPPLDIDCPTVDLDWRHYNCPTEWPAFDDAGMHTVSAVVHCAWRYGDGAAVVLLDVDRVPHTVDVPLDTGTLRLPADCSYAVDLVAKGTRTALGALPADGVVTVDLPSRAVVVLEITPR
jgi:hypothetical protein